MQNNWFLPGSNRRPPVCETDVITNYTKEPSLRLGIGNAV